MTRVLALVFLLGARAAAQTGAPDVLYLSGFDTADTATTTAIDPLEFVSTLAGGAVDADLRIQRVTSSGRTHNASNGGPAASEWSGFVTVTAGESAYYTLSTTGMPVLAESLMTTGIALHVPATGAPTLSRDILEHRMGTGGRGCFLRLNSDRTLGVFYETTAIAFGASVTTLKTNACSGDPTIGCTVNADCPSAQTCATCSTTTGAGCFWPTVELVQRNLPSASGDAVVCDLWVNGQQEVISTVQPPAPSLGPITGIRLGATGTEATGMDLGFDDLVISRSARAGFGYVDTAGATAVGVPMQWTEDSCGSGVAFLKCVDDFTLTPFVLTSTGLQNSLRANKTGKTATYARWGPIPTPPADGRYGALQPTIIGRTGSDAGTYTLGVQAALCSDPALACESLSGELQFDFGQNITPVLVAAPVFPVPPGGGTWNVSSLAQFGVSTRSIAIGNAGQIRQAGVLTYLHLVRPDAPLPQTLRDHNIGTDDGLVYVYTFGDSLARATGAITCFGGTQNGQPCNEPTYCSWDSINKSKPIGGCGAANDPNHAICQTCTQRRLEFNNGAGYQCTADAQCNLGTCSGSTCALDTDVPCGVDADCNLGTCETGATCLESCPNGGTCPARTGWPLPLVGRLNVDGIVNCAQDALQTPAVRAYVFPTALTGYASQCQVIAGPAGQCECFTNAECQTTAGGVCSFARGQCSSTRHRSCTTNADCTGGFDLCMGLCTASDNGRASCDAANDCPSIGPGQFRPCRYPPPDYTIVHMSPNDVGANVCTIRPDCNNGYGVGGICDNCAETACVDTSTCAAIAPSSRCIGVMRTDANTACLEGSCTAFARRCRVAADCGTTGLTCTGGAPADVTAQGWCTCTADAQCPGNAFGAGFGLKCVAGTCRTICTTNAHCGSTGAAICDVGTGSCQGRCTCPCESKSCTTDSDCPVWEQTFQPLLTKRIASGKCVAGKCQACGFSCCRDDPTDVGQHAYLMNTHRWVGGHLMPDEQRTMAQLTRTFNDPTPPLHIPVTLPEWRLQTQAPRCDGRAGDAAAYARRTRANLLADTVHFPVVVDAMPVLAATSHAENYVDDLHYGALGADRVGLEIAAILNSLNVCVTGARETAKAQTYCQQTDGTFTTTLCAVLTDCGSNQHCRVRPCTVDDETTAGCPGAPTCNLEPTS